MFQAVPFPDGDDGETIICYASASISNTIEIVPLRHRVIEDR